MCASENPPITTEYEDDIEDNYELQDFVWSKWNDTLHTFNNNTLQYILIQSDAIHVNFYTLFGLLTIFVIGYIIQSSLWCKKKLNFPQFSSIPTNPRENV